MSRKSSSISKKTWGLLGLLACLGLAAILGISGRMAHMTDDLIVGDITSPDGSFTEQQIEEFKGLEADCILVLGAGVYSDGTPTPMLRNRLETGIALYKAKAAPKLLLTGDNGQEEYNEVAVMLAYVKEKGVPEKDIFLDYAGFSTYESIYRAKAIFKVNKAIVVTQRYHLFRALYGCEAMGIDALGAASDQEIYSGSRARELREVLARDKDWIKWMIKPEPTYLGEEIPITGDGRATQ